MIDPETEQALDKLIKSIASTAQIELLRQKLSAGQISIDGDVNRSVIILGDGNTVDQYQLTPEMVDDLSKPLANGRTLLVVVDGLDEAADWQAGADFVPAELPAGVRVLVSARFLAGDAQRVAQAKSEMLTCTPGTVRQDGVRWVQCHA